MQVSVQFEVLACSNVTTLSIEYFVTRCVHCIFVEPIPSRECRLPYFPIAKSFEVSNPLLSVLLEVDDIACVEDLVFPGQCDEPTYLISLQFAKYLLHCFSSPLVPRMFRVTSFAPFGQGLDFDACP